MTARLRRRKGRIFERGRAKTSFLAGRDHPRLRARRVTLNPPLPSQEGSFVVRAGCRFPSQEGSSVRSPPGRGRGGSAHGEEGRLRHAPVLIRGCAPRLRELKSKVATLQLEGYIHHEIGYLSN